MQAAGLHPVRLSGYQRSRDEAFRIDQLRCEVVAHNAPRI